MFMDKMKRTFVFMLLALTMLYSCSSDDESTPENNDVSEITYDANRKILVAYFSATGNTRRLAGQIVSETDADVFRIEAAEPYAENPYDDSDRIQNESYNDLRPDVAVLPDNVEDYDVIFVGSPIWWHNMSLLRKE